MTNRSPVLKKPGWLFARCRTRCTRRILHRRPRNPVRGGIAVDIGGMMERPALELFSMMCSQISLVGSLWFSTSEAQDMAEMAGSGALDFSVLEHHILRLDQINEALDSIPARHGGFINFICQPS